jgi:hypothetical protein
MDPDQFISIIVQALTALGAAFGGAAGAFYLQDEKELEKERKERVALINKALIMLVRQYQALENIRLELEPHKDNVVRHITAPGVTTNLYSDVRIKVETLSFLIGSSDPNLLMKIMLEQERFEMALKAVELRTNRHVGSIQPRYAELGLADGALIQLTALEKHFGEFLYKTIKNETDLMYRIVYECAESTLVAIDDLCDYAKRTYLYEKFIRILKA